jgi:hypothetical protein
MGLIWKEEIIRSFKGATGHKAASSSALTSQDMLLAQGIRPNANEDTKARSSKCSKHSQQENYSEECSNQKWSIANRVWKVYRYRL